MWYVILVITGHNGSKSKFKSILPEVYAADNDNYCWFTLVQVLAHVTPHAVYFIMLESHLLQHNHCNSPVVAKYNPMNMVWVTNMHCIRYLIVVDSTLSTSQGYICTMHHLTSGSVET